MIEVKKTIETGQPFGLYAILKQLQEVNAGLSGQVFFVDSSTGSDSNNGKSWEQAFSTLTYAIAFSNDKRSGFQRNTIFCRGDFTETLTTAPSKTDIVGVGSTNARPKPRITGTQAFATTAYGTRFINLNFRGDAADAVVTFTAGGFEMYNCVFSHPGAATATHGLALTNPTDVIIKGCDFEMRNELFFSSYGISLQLTEVTNRCKIIDCRIRGAVGIWMSGDAGWYDSSLENCFVYSSGLCVHDVGDMWMLINNTFITQAANTDDDMLTYAEHLSAGNIATGATETVTAPEIEVRTT